MKWNEYKKILNNTLKIIQNKKSIDLSTEGLNTLLYIFAIKPSEPDEGRLVENVVSSG